MVDDEVRSASAPDPLSDGPSTQAEAPAPLPLPTPVTGYPGGGGRGGRSRNREDAIVTVLVVLSLVIAAGLTVYLLRSQVAGLGAALRTTLSAPFTNSERDAGATPAVIAALHKRASKEYPAFTVASVESAEGEATASDTSRVMRVFFTLKTSGHRGFEFVTVYVAPSATATDPATYENLDDFFRMPMSPPQPVDSFIVMWLHEHPGEACDYVIETGDVTDDPRLYDVGYTRREQNGGAVSSVQGEYHLAYSAQTGAWEETSAASASAAVEETLPPEPDDGTRPDGSLEDTQAAVTAALPGFRAAGTATTSNGDPLIVVRNGAHRGFRMAVDPIFLSPPDPEDEGMVALFRGGRTKADAFVKEWSARYPGTVIDQLTLDPDSTGDSNAADISYVKSVPQVDDLRFERESLGRYDPKTHRWKFTPYQP